MLSFLDARKRWQEIQQAGRPADAELRVALLATFTIDRLGVYVGAGLGDLGMTAAVHITAYDQIIQECLTADSPTAAFQPNVVVCWPRLEDLWRAHPLPLAAADDYAADALAVLDASVTAAKRWGATLVFVLPAIPETRPLGIGDATAPTGVAATAARIREQLRAALIREPGALVLDADELIRTIGSAHAYNPRMDAVAHVPYAEAVFGLAGAQLARLIMLSRRAAKKVLVVDGDNTLWGGVIGEDGVAGVDLLPNGPGAAFCAFQRYLRDLRAAGVLLALCSKNEEADVWAVFERREMVLRRSDLAAWRIGWNPKSVGLQAIADELGLGIDSLVFIDDNPMEIAEVHAHLPTVTCIQMPADPAGWLAAIQGSGALDRLPPTAEDRARADWVAQDKQRGELERVAVSRDDYLAQLGLRVELRTPDGADLARVAQLAAKTNQMNINGRRRSVAEIAAALAEPERWIVRAVIASDRFGDSGIVGVYVAHRGADATELDTFLVSCRALGRGVEEAMLAGAIADVARAGWPTLHAEVLELPRNQVARAFFTSMSCAIGAGPQRVAPGPAWPSWIARVAS